MADAHRAITPEESQVPLGAQSLEPPPPPPGPPPGYEMGLDPSGQPHYTMKAKAAPFTTMQDSIRTTEGMLHDTSMLYRQHIRRRRSNA